MTLLAASPIWFWQLLWGGIGYNIYMVDITSDASVLAVDYLKFDPDIAIISEYSYKKGHFDRNYYIRLLAALKALQAEISLTHSADCFEATFNVLKENSIRPNVFREYIATIDRYIFFSRMEKTDPVLHASFEKHYNDVRNYLIFLVNNPPPYSTKYKMWSVLVHETIVPYFPNPFRDAEPYVGTEEDEERLWGSPNRYLKHEDNYDPDKDFWETFS